MTTSASNVDNAGTICHDFALFQETLKKWRMIDDRIANALNCSVLTDSFKQASSPEGACKHFYEELLSAHKARNGLIKTCVKEASARVNHLQELKNQPSSINGNSGDVNYENAVFSLRKEQRTLRQIQQELSVEEIIQDRSFKAYQERCRLLYTPPQQDTRS